VVTTSYNTANQVTVWHTATLSYDANGSLTADGTYTYTWNARNQLADVKQKSDGATLASFGYDAYGRRSNKTTSGSTSFVYRGINPVQEISGTTTNVWSGGTDEFFKRGNDTLLQDALGSTIAVVDGSGVVQTQYTYEPFGKTTVTGAANSNPYQFTGRENDGVAGLYFHRARYFSPALGRFISQDPIGFRGGINLYAYANNAPIDFADACGLSPRKPSPNPPFPPLPGPNPPIPPLPPLPGPNPPIPPIPPFPPIPPIPPFPPIPPIPPFPQPPDPVLAKGGCSCTTSCYLEPANKRSTAVCTGSVSGTGTGGTRNEACKAAKKDASSQAPRGCKTKHCDPCTCTC
jgi:RHS repeat-associated protein